MYVITSYTHKFTHINVYIGINLRDDLCALDSYLGFWSIWILIFDDYMQNFGIFRFLLLVLVLELTPCQQKWLYTTIFGIGRDCRIRTGGEGGFLEAFALTENSAVVEPEANSFILIIIIIIILHEKRLWVKLGGKPNKLSADKQSRFPLSFWTK